MSLRNVYPMSVLCCCCCITCVVCAPDIDAKEDKDAGFGARMVACARKDAEALVKNIPQTLVRVAALVALLGCLQALESVSSELSNVAVITSVLSVAAIIKKPEKAAGVVAGIAFGATESPAMKAVGALL